jgi:hypothetical protein
MLRSLKTVVFIYFWAFLQVSVLCTYNCANYKCANLVVTCITSYLKMFSIWDSLFFYTYSVFEADILFSSLVFCLFNLLIAMM